MYQKYGLTLAKPGLIFILTFALTLAGCDLSFMGDEVDPGGTGSDGGGNNQGGNDDPMEVTVNGDVGVTGVTNSFIIVTKANGATAWSGRSSNNSDYSATMSVLSTDFPLTTLAFGGSDIVSGFSPDFNMRSMVLSPSTTVSNINPLSTIISATAGNQGRGVNESSMAVATQVILKQLNFGLDTSRISDPITSPILNSNVATFFRSNEAVAEMIRRTCRALLLAGFSLSADQAIAHLSGDLTDGVIDGRGIGSDARVAATSSIVSAQILLEAMTNELQVGGFDAAARLDAAISMTHPGASVLTGDLTAPAEMISQAALTITAAYDLSATAPLAGLFDAVSAMPIGATVATARQVLPSDSSQIMEASISKVTAGTASDHEIVNARMRMGLDSNTIDRTPPIISLVGSPTIPLSVGDAYVEQGATATDDRDGDLTSLINIDNQSVETSVANDYVVTYNVSDFSGNSAAEVVRTVSVSASNTADSIPPIIALIGDNPQNLIQGDSYVELGATATDNVDGDITSSILIDSSAVTTSTAGNYPVAYNVSDTAGNAASQVTRTVRVVSDPGSNGSNPWEAILGEATGFGRNVTGGSGGRLVTVTNLNNSGSGSLRQAIADASGPTWIRFAKGLSGTIRVVNGITVKKRDITIDGRGANILIDNSNDSAFTLNLDAPNIVLMFVKFDSGDVRNYSDAVEARSKTDGLWIHHVSFTGAGDDQFSVRNMRGISPIGNITISWSKFSGASGAGPILINGTVGTGGVPVRITLHHNDISSGSRGPFHRNSRIHEYNNYLHDWGNYGYVIGVADGRAYFESNYCKPGNYPEVGKWSPKELPSGKFFVRNNTLNGATFGRTNSNSADVFEPTSFYSYTLDVPNAAMRDNIVANAGYQSVAFPGDQ